VLVGYDYVDSFNAARASYYGITAWPTICGDGLSDIWPCTPTTLTADYNAHNARTSPVRMRVTENGEGDFTAHVYAEQAVADAKFVMVAVLDEYVPCNGGGQSHLPFHAKVFLTAVTGDAFALAAGDSVEIQRTFTVSPSWDYSKMGVACWIQKPGGTNPSPSPAIPIRNQVLQAAFCPAGSTSVPESDDGTVVLLAPRPNPSRADTRVSFTLPQAADVSVAVYDAAGRLVAGLVEGALPAGPHEAVWDGRTDGGTLCASGVYFARLVCDGEDAGVQKLVRIE